MTDAFDVKRVVEESGKKVIRFYRKNVYGNTLNYPLDFVIPLQVLTDKATMTNSIMDALRALGFEFAEVFAPN